MNTSLTVILAAALLAQPPGAGIQRGLEPESPPSVKPAYRSATSLQYGKHAAQSFGINYYRMLYGPDVIDDPEAMARIYREFSPATYMTPDAPPTLYLNKFTPPPGPNASMRARTSARTSYAFSVGRTLITTSSAWTPTIASRKLAARLTSS